MLRVTPETATPVANAPSRASRADQAPAPDGFSALIEGAAEPRRNDPAGASVPERPSRQRADAPSALNGEPRDTAADAPTSVASQQTAVSAEPVTPEGGAETVRKTGKIAIAKTGIPSEIPDLAADDNTAVSDAVTSQQPANPTAIAAVVAIAVAAPLAVTGSVATPTSSGKAPEPLAIAAAAIAVSQSTLEATKPEVTAAMTPIKPAPDAPVSPAAALAGPAAALSKPATAIPVPPPAADTAAIDTPNLAEAPVIPPGANDPLAKNASPADRVVASADEPATAGGADPELTLAATPVLTGVPTAPKATAKASPKAIDGVAPVESATDGAAASPSATPTKPDAKSVAPQGLAIDGDPKSRGAALAIANADGAKTEAATIPAAAGTPRERHVDAMQLPFDASAAGGLEAVQQALQPASAPASPAPWSVTASHTAAVPLNGVALQIAVTAQSGRSRFEIRLDPAELGRIDVRIDVDRHGQMTSHLTVEKPETLAMLRQDAPQLQRALDQAGFRTGDNGLQFSLRDQGSSGQSSGQEAFRHAQRLIISDDDGVPASLAGRSYGRLSGSGSGVDISV